MGIVDDIVDNAGPDRTPMDNSSCSRALFFLQGPGTIKYFGGKRRHIVNQVPMK
jgi:hypothetical protein